MGREIRRALRVFAQFLVAGGFTGAVDAGIVALAPAGSWRCSHALTHLAITFAQAYLEDREAIHRRSSRYLVPALSWPRKIGSVYAALWSNRTAYDDLRASSGGRMMSRLLQYQDNRT